MAGVTQLKSSKLLNEAFYKVQNNACFKFEFKITVDTVDSQYVFLDQNGGKQKYVMKYVLKDTCACGDIEILIIMYRGTCLQ